MKKLGYILIFLLVLSACKSEVHTPKPKGYFRIYYPAKKYIKYEASAPFTFEYPAYAKVVKDNEPKAQPYWNNLDFPQFNGRLHLTYHGVFSPENYSKMTEAARNLAMKHTIKASAIDQRMINYPDKQVYGIYYEIQGNTASSVQFFLTDSSKHYFRGALYFNEAPKYDSIQPIVKFIKKDIDHLIESFKWKN